MGAPHGAWDPDQYLKFRDQRAQPFFDLAALVERRDRPRVLDLGCGTGELTRWLHEELGAASTLGIDLSREMLEQSAEHVVDGLRFEQADITQFVERHDTSLYDVIFSNAALQWVDHHDWLFPQIRSLLAPGGQLAVQVPFRSSHPAGEALADVLTREPYASAVDGYRRTTATREPDWYAALLHRLGAPEQRVEMRVYGHVLENSRAAVEWLKGSALTPYKARLTPELYESLVTEYEEEVVACCGESTPYFLPFNRILIWARFP